MNTKRVIEAINIIIKELGLPVDYLKLKDQQDSSTMKFSNEIYNSEDSFGGKFDHTFLDRYKDSDIDLNKPISTQNIDMNVADSLVDDDFGGK